MCSLIVFRNNYIPAWNRIDSGLRFSTKGFTDGSSIEKKYGEQILGIGDTAKEYFNIMYLRPWMERFFSECGYR